MPTESTHGPMVKYWTEAEQKKLLGTPAALRDILARRDTAWMHLLVLTGFRIKEFSLLTVGAAESALATGWIFIPRAVRKRKARDHEKIVTVEVRRWLTEAIALHKEMGGDGAAEAPLVLTREGEMLSVRSYQERVKHWRRKAGLPAGTPHWFRHTRAMNIVHRSTCENDQKLRKVLQLELGHADMRSADAYIGLTKEDLARAAQEADGGRLTRRQARRYYAGAQPMTTAVGVGA